MVPAKRNELEPWRLCCCSLVVFPSSLNTSLLLPNCGTSASSGVSCSLGRGLCGNPVASGIKLFTSILYIKEQGWDVIHVMFCE